MSQQTKKYLFPYILTLSLVFFLWQLLFTLFSGTNNIVISIILHSGIKIPLNVIWPNLFYFAVQFILYALLAVAIWLVARLASKRIRLSKEKTEKYGLYLFVFVATWLLLANQIKFPYSRFSVGLLDQYAPLTVIKILFSIISLVIAAAIILAIIQLTIELFSRTKKGALKTTFLIASLLFGAVFIFHYRTSPPPAPQTKKPNIFIIGLDALRPDYVGYYGAKEKNTPYLDQFLSESTNFTSSLTPLARTLPAWVSILTGQYPTHNHARDDLIRRDHLILSNSLPELLQKKGYYTVYSTDDERFSNITKPFGFNQIIGPKIGVNDFVIGTLNDFPLSNLLVNTRIGSVLYPYSYGNREAFAVYDPSSFNQMVEDRLPISSKKPLFLCIHFCLTHLPYIWGDEKFHANYSNADLYKIAEQRIDQQLEDFIHYLEKNHLLDNAIVVIISDHGEALGLPGDRLISQSKFVGKIKNKNKLFESLTASDTPDPDTLNVSYGHGTDVLSKSQYKTLLAFRFFGKQQNQRQNFQGLTSLIDIKPTLLNAIHLQSPDTDGISLLPYIQGTSNQLPPRMIFTETGFTPFSLDTKNISITNVVFQSIDLFGIDPVTDYLYTKPKSVNLLLKAKQRAVYYKNWVLAFYPIEGQKPLTVLVNTTTGEWTTSLNDQLAKQSKAKAMLSAIKKHYGKELVE